MIVPTTRTKNKTQAKIAMIAIRAVLVPFTGAVSPSSTPSPSVPGSSLTSASLIGAGGEAGGKGDWRYISSLIGAGGEALDCGRGGLAIHF